MTVYLVMRGRDYASSFINDVLFVYTDKAKAEQQLTTLKSNARGSWWKYYIEEHEVS